MDFFDEQERARRTSRWFLLWYLLAGAGVVASYCLVAGLGHALFTAAGGAPVAGFNAWVAGPVGLSIVAASAWRMWQLREGGPAIAELLGARYVESGRCTGEERRLLNVVEEMAIASGIAVPAVYLLDREPGVNALVAGYSPNEAVIVFTRGAVEKLTRDELQGVVAHEFSHILNGDMALNMFLAGLLAGLTWLGSQGEQLALSAIFARDLSHRPSGNPLSVLLGTFIAWVGFPGALAADAIRARISRERELLADAASVQLTRNPEGIAGALDSLLSLPATTVVSAAYCRELSHMFFAPPVTRWWGFATHPPIAERIRRAAPRFQRDDYRARRYGRSRDVAVLDGLGNVVKHVRAFGREAVARPSAQHVDFAARLLRGLPQGLRDALREPHGAETAAFALGFEPAQREASLALLGRLRGPDCARAADELHLVAGGLARQHLLTLADLAIPAIKSQPQQARDRFLADFAALVELDGRVTLREFVLFTLFKQRLREGAGLPIRTQFRSLGEIAGDAVVILSLVCLAGRDPQAFTRAAKIVDLEGATPLAAGALTTTRVGESLERVRHLSPFAKPALLKACCEAAGADGNMTLAEAELVRVVAATLDCPLPPVAA